MAKRKRIAGPSTSSRKKLRAGGHAHGKIDSQEEYRLKSIVGEDETHDRYLISWEDDPETGESFVDTWEPRANANQAAIDDWERQKADKARLESRIGKAAVRSRSSSLSSPPRARSAEKPITLKLSRPGRPRKVVESSPKSSPPQPSVSQPTNGQQALPPADELLEIGESQQSQAEEVAQDLPDSSTASPLFVTDHDAVVIAHQRTVSVAPSPPHSSYQAGAYQYFSASSQLQPSDPPAASQSEPSQPEPAQPEPSQPEPSQPEPSQIEPSEPEPSQYQPDPADTSGTTEGTTEISAVQTTPSQPTRSIPVNFGETPGLVADSQSLPGSSSYIQSAEKSTSESQSSAVESIDSSSAPAQIPASQRVEQESESGQIQPVPPSSGLEQPEASASQPILSAESSTQPPPAAAESAVSENQATASGSAPKESQDLSSSSIDTRDFADSQSASQSNLAASANEPPRDSSEHSSSLQTSASAIPQQDGAGQEWDFSALDNPPQNTSSSNIQPTSAQPQPAVSSSATESGADSAHKELSGQLDTSALLQVPDQPATQLQDRVEDDRPPIDASQGSSTEDEEPAIGSAPQADAGQVELISSTEAAQESPGFSITPPTRTAISFDHSLLGRQLPDSSDFFPFQTQVPRAGISSRTTLFNSRSQNSQTEVLQQTDNTATAPIASGSDRPAHSSQTQTSSPVPNPPSHSIETGIFLGESAPPRPELPSTPLRPSPFGKMDRSQRKPIVEGSLAASIKAMRARHRASHESMKSTPVRDMSSTPAQDNDAQAAPAATAPPAVTVSASERILPVPAPVLRSPLLLAQDGRRSPSAVPHEEPLPVITQEEMNTSARYETLLPQSQSYGHDDRRNGSLASTGTPSNPNEGENSENTDLHTIPIAMAGSQKDQYPSTVYFYRTAIQRFLEDGNPDAELVGELKNFIERMRRITMHPDLDNSETLTQYDVDPAHQADWDEKCSAKFRFLKEIFSALKYEEITVAIVARPGRVVDMLQTFLKGKKISYRRLGTNPSQSSEGHGNVKAVLLDTSVEPAAAQPVDLVIAMENLVRHDTPLVRALRHRANRWAPFVSLIVPRTVEHIERCLSPELSEQQVSCNLISGIYQFRNDAGRLEPGQQPTKDAAIALAQYLTRTDPSAPWPITSLTLLQDLDNQGESGLHVDGATSGHAGTKRSREPEEASDDVEDRNKRARTAPQSSVAQADVTHISDSVDNSTQPGQTISEQQSTAQKTNEERLSRLLMDAQRREAEHREALLDLQYRHEGQRNKLLELTKERDLAIDTAQTATVRLGEDANKMSALRARRSELEAELKEANARLLDHTIPERAEFEALRIAAVQANADKEKVEAKVQQKEQQIEYFRSAYQTASSTAQEYGTKNTELENEVAVLRNKATGQQIQLREMHLDDFTKNLRNENKKLKVMLKDRETGIKFRDEEIAKLKEASRGRMGTRNSSVPRTPRLGSPMKGRVGSRQTSPAAGELRERNTMLHPLRNAQGS